MAKGVEDGMTRNAGVEKESRRREYWCDAK
jgi:hypothetical protein